MEWYKQAIVGEDKDTQMVLQIIASLAGLASNIGEIRMELTHRGVGSYIVGRKLLPVLKKLTNVVYGISDVVIKVSKKLIPQGASQTAINCVHGVRMEIGRELLRFKEYTTNKSPASYDDTELATIEATLAKLEALLRDFYSVVVEDTWKDPDMAKKYGADMEISGVWGVVFNSMEAIRNIRSEIGSIPDDMPIEDSLKRFEILMGTGEGLSRTYDPTNPSDVSNLRGVGQHIAHLIVLLRRFVLSKVSWEMYNDQVKVMEKGKDKIDKTLLDVKNSGEKPTTAILKEWATKGIDVILGNLSVLYNGLKNVADLESRQKGAGDFNPN